MHPSALAKRLYLLLFLVIIAFYLYGLGRLPLLGPDEPRYAEVAREMLMRGDLITPTLGGHTWFEKPALLYWLLMASFKIFGVHEWSARLGPALCGLLTIAAVAYIGREIERGVQRAAEVARKSDGEGVSGEERAFGFWGVLVAASSLGLAVFSRAVSFDVVITMTTAWALAFFIKRELSTEKRSAALIGFYVFVGLSLLAKGLVGIVIPFGVVGLYFLLRRAWPARRVWLSLLWGVPLAIAVSGVWYGPVIARHGWTFIDEFFIQHHFARYVSNKYHHPQPIYFYLLIILLLPLPWTAFFVDALAKVRTWAWRGSDALSIVRVFALAWLALPIVFFSFSGSKLPGYILPSLPAVALLVADRFIHAKSRWPMRATGVIYLALAVGGFVYLSRSGHITLLCATAVALPMALAAGAALFARDEQGASRMAICGGTFVLLMLILICAAVPFAQGESVKDLLQVADARGYANAPVLSQRTDDRSAQFYAHDRVVYNAEGEVITFDEVSLEEAQALGSKLLILIPVRHLDNFRGAPQFEIIGDNGHTALIGWKP